MSPKNLHRPSQRQIVIEVAIHVVEILMGAEMILIVANLVLI